MSEFKKVNVQVKQEGTGSALRISMKKFSIQLLGLEGVCRDLPRKLEVRRGEVVAEVVMGDSHSICEAHNDFGEFPVRPSDGAPLALGQCFSLEIRVVGPADPLPKKSKQKDYVPTSD